MPKAEVDALREAALLKANPGDFLTVPVERMLGDNPGVERGALLEGLLAFHRERMEKAPPADRFPESAAWVSYIRARDARVRAETGFSELDMAVLRSLHAYVTFRGFSRLPPAVTERCRVVYAPETDNGQFHIKNVDDPATHWKGAAKPTGAGMGDAKLIWDGVGSGMHMDDEPEQIFPLPIPRLVHHYADTVPAAVEFLTRYSPFWGSQNIVLHDRAKRSVAINKSSYNFIEVYYPGPDGCSHCSGMACQDLRSPQSLYLKKKRAEILGKMGRGADCTENAFWAACDRAEAMLAECLKAMKGRITIDPVIELLTTPWPAGLNKTGALLHPDQPVGEYTLITHLTLLDLPATMMWARDGATLAYPEKPWVVNPSGKPIRSRFAG
jgi:hypothetical protein